MTTIQTENLSLQTLYELSGLKQREIGELVNMQQAYVGVVIKCADKLPEIRRVLTEAVEQRFGGDGQQNPTPEAS